MLGVQCCELCHLGSATGRRQSRNPFPTRLTARKETLPWRDNPLPECQFCSYCRLRSQNLIRKPNCVQVLELIEDGALLSIALKPTYLRLYGQKPARRLRTCAAQARTIWICGSTDQSWIWTSAMSFSISASVRQLAGEAKASARALSLRASGTKGVILHRLTQPVVSLGEPLERRS